MANGMRIGFAISVALSLAMLAGLARALSGRPREAPRLPSPGRRAP